MTGSNIKWNLSISGYIVHWKQEILVQFIQTTIELSILFELFIYTNLYDSVLKEYICESILYFFLWVQQAYWVINDKYGKFWSNQIETHRIFLF